MRERVINKKSITTKVMRQVQVLSDASKKFNAKLASKWYGPLTILKDKTSTVYDIDSKVREIRGLSLMQVSYIAEALCSIKEIVKSG